MALDSNIRLLITSFKNWLTFRSYSNCVYNYNIGPVNDRVSIENIHLKILKIYRMQDIAEGHT